MAGAAGSMQGGNNTSHKAPGGQGIIETGSAGDGNLQSAEEVLPASDGETGGGLRLVVVVNGDRLKPRCKRSCQLLLQLQRHGLN
ncbi:MAG: hypothetical protein ACHQT6_09200 [Candidatus Acidiferrales bacterium]